MNFYQRPTAEVPRNYLSCCSCSGHFVNFFFKDKINRSDKGIKVNKTLWSNVSYQPHISTKLLVLHKYNLSSLSKLHCIEFPRQPPSDCPRGESQSRCSCRRCTSLKRYTMSWGCHSSMDPSLPNIHGPGFKSLALHLLSAFFKIKVEELEDN